MTDQTKDSKWDTKYRPSSIDELIGHEQAVTRIRGMIAKDAFPSSMLIMGPTSVGKTTIARALAGTINGRPIEEQVRSGTYKEMDGGSQRTIDEMRELVKLSKFRPQGKKRIIVLDEAQSILANKIAAQALLKPLEESGKTDTIWILCSMDGAKFKSTEEGRAMLNRCSQFVLKPHTEADKLAFAKRVIIREGMKYFKDLELRQKLIQTCAGMRDVASGLQAVDDYWHGLVKKPSVLGAEGLAEAMDSMEEGDDKMAATLVSSALQGNFTACHLAVLNVSDAFTVINKMLWVSQFLLSIRVLDGKKHPKVWWAPANRLANDQLKGKKVALGQLAAMLETCVQLKNESMNFTVDAQGLISAKLFRFIKDNFGQKEQS